MPIVSIIIPVYNVAPYLDVCFDSIANQEFKDFEAIVVDDGSTDGSGLMCDAWAKRDSRFVVIHQNNRGLSAARNVGLDRATGEYVQFVDSDDCVDARYTGAMISYVRSTGCDCVLCGYMRERKGVREILQPCSEPVLISSHECVRSCLDVRRGDRFRISFGMWVRIYKRSVFSENGIRFPEGRVYEDVCVFVPTLHASELIALVPDVLYYKRDHPESITWEMTARDAREYVDAYRTMGEDVASYYPDLTSKAYGSCEHSRITAWLRLARDAQYSDPDVASTLATLRREAIQHWRDLRLPDDARHAAALLAIAVAPGVTTRLYDAWRRRQGL